MLVYCFVFILCFCVSEASHHFHLNDEIVLVCNNFFISTVFVGSGVSQVIVHFMYKGKSPQKRHCSVLLSAICMQNLIRIIPPPCSRENGDILFLLFVLRAVGMADCASVYQ